jgi:glyoxylate/hydroxypyruvate reductase A
MGGRILFSSDIDDPVGWDAAVRALRPDMAVVDWRDVSDPAAFEFALLWKPPPGGLGAFTGLKAIQSLGAGVNQLDLAALPAGVPLARLIDASLTETMVDYAIAALYRHFRAFDRYERDTRARHWAHAAPPDKARFPVGVMGLGVLGGAIARQIHALGFPVHGWSRARKPLDGIVSHAGPEGLPGFMAAVRLVICVLPLTPATAGILNARTLAALPAGAFVVNIGRGGHVAEPDLAALVRDGHIAGATLDVFAAEPLPRDHSFYDLPQILVTPHVAGCISPWSAAGAVLENYDRALAGRPLINQVEPARGY